MEGLDPDRLGVRIGRLVRQARTHRRMKLTDLAERVGRTAAQISTLERGIYQWTDSVLEACAKALDLSLAELLAEENEVVLRLPDDPEAMRQARRLADRLKDASVEELRGLLVWSELYRNHSPSPDAHLRGNGRDEPPPPDEPHPTDLAHS